MDNSIVMGMRQEADGYAIGGGMPYGEQQDAYAVPEKDIPEGFFQDAALLGHTPFDEGVPEDGVQEAAPMEADLVGMEESLPVAPVMGQVSGQFPGGFVEKGWEGPASETEDSWEPDPEGCCMDEGGPEEMYDEEAVEEKTEMVLQEEKNAGDSTVGAAEEDRERAEHEASEAKRKAEWEARQQARKDAEKAQMERIAAMGSEELAAESMKRVGADTEKLTRRNMKECVAEYIQTLCLEDTEFARRVMLPQKNMVRCFQYINRKAYEYVQEEMKAAGIQPGRDTPCYASDIPDDACYHWAEEYFRTTDVKEDKEEGEEFIPKPYAGTVSGGSKGKKGSTKKAPSKKPAGKKTAEKKAPGKEPPDRKPEGGKAADGGQPSFMGQMSFGDFMEGQKAG